MKHILIIILFKIIFTFHLRNANLSLTNRGKENTIDEYLERLSYLALQRISEGLLYLADDTSCKVAGKYILLTIANIQKQEDRKSVYFTNNTDTDINTMKNLLISGKILQIEFLPNHHIILFAKNTTHLYELQAFQNVYQLKDWMRNIENVKAKNIDEFFSTVKQLVDNTNIDRDKFNKVMLDLFMPNYFINDTEKVNAIKEWFKYYPYCKIVRADAVDYDFTNDPLDPNYFKDLFHDVDHQFLLRVKKTNSWYDYLF